MTEPELSASGGGKDGASGIFGSAARRLAGKLSFENGAGGEKRGRGYLALCFILPALVMWLIYICMRVFPFGNESVLVLDLNGQYVYFFEALRRLIYGDGSFLYSFGRALGGEFFGIYAYYLASPLSYIVALFPKEYITEALLCIFLLKCGGCGLCFGIYIDATRKPSGKPATVAAVMFSAMYALSAYAVVMQHNTMWIDNVMLLPLITLGIERMIKYRRFKLFVITLTVAVFSNFYIGYMTCIYVAVYFFYYFAANKRDVVNPLGERAHFSRSLLRIAIYSLLALAVCAVLLATAYYSLTFGKTDFTQPSYEFKQQFDFAELLSKFFFGSYDTVRPAGLPFVYCGMLALILAPLYFITPGISAREKTATGVLAAFFILSFNSSTLDLIWHGFQKPNWLNYRYSFMLCFILLLMAYRAWEKIREINLRSVITVASALMLMLVVLQKLELEPENLSDLSAVWPSLALCAVYILLVRFVKTSGLRETSAALMAAVVSAELFAGGLVNLVDLDEDVVYSSRTSYRTFIDRVQPAAELLTDGDDTFYRMEKTVHRKVNDNLALGIRGLSNSTSTLNASTVKFLRQLGLASKSHWSKYLGGTPVLDSLLGIKYLITEADEPDNGIYNKKFVYNNDLACYVNPLALPLAYASDEAVADLDLDEFTSPFTRMNAMLAALLGDERLNVLGKNAAEVFIPVEIINTGYENCVASYTSGHKKLTPASAGKQSKTVFTLAAETDGIIYAYFPSDYLREAKLTVNGADAGTYYANETYRIVTLGWFAEGEELTVSLTINNDKNELYIASDPTYFYSVDTDRCEAVFRALAEGGYEINAHTEDSFEGVITVPEGAEYVYVTVPFDEGWKVTLDGELVETFEVLGSTTAFAASAGEHTLSMRYRPDVYLLGLAVTVCGILLFAALCVLERLKKRGGGSDDVPDDSGEAVPDAVADDFELADAENNRKEQYRDDIPHQGNTDGEG